MESVHTSCALVTGFVVKYKNEEIVERQLEISPHTILVEMVGRCNHALYRSAAEADSIFGIDTQHFVRVVLPKMVDGEANDLVGLSTNLPYIWWNCTCNRV